MRSDDAELLKAIKDIAREAGDLAFAWFRAGKDTKARIDWKHGGSPVSEADYEVDVFLRARLGALAPDAGWLSEETTDGPARLDHRRVFIVDPIDGTRAFIRGDWRWAVSIALIEDGAPRLGVLRLPARDLMFEARAGGGAFLNGRKLQASQRPDLAGATIAGPLNILDAMARNGLDIAREPRVPSLAYRLARVATGEVDAAIASTDAWDWDIAAADLIVRESGGVLSDLDGRAPVYNRERPRHGVLGAAPAQLHDALVSRLRKASGAPEGADDKPIT